MNSNSISLAEYRILDYVSEVFIPIQWLRDRRAVNETLNKPFHNLDKDALIHILYKLFDEGYIIAHRRESVVPLALDLQDIERSLDLPFIPDPQTYTVYGVTQKGGALWEKEAQPNWNLFVYETYGGEGLEPHEGVIITSSRQSTEYRLYQLKEEKDPISGIIDSSEQWDILSPWQATYWKILPIGHRVRFSYIDDEDS